MKRLQIWKKLTKSEFDKESKKNQILSNLILEDRFYLTNYLKEQYKTGEKVTLQKYDNKTLSFVDTQFNVTIDKIYDQFMNEHQETSEGWKYLITIKEKIKWELKKKDSPDFYAVISQNIDQEVIKKLL